MAILQWGTLIICSVVLLLRVPDAIRGRNRMVFGILLLATLCSLLSVPGPYQAIDLALGGWNLTHLILRFLVFTAVLLIGLRVAKGLADVRGYRLIAGPARTLGPGGQRCGGGGDILPHGHRAGPRPACWT